MYKSFFILAFILCTLAFPVSVKAQYYSVNIDYRTVAEMSAAFNTEAATEMYYAEQIANKILTYRKKGKSPETTTALENIIEEALDFLPADEKKDTKK